MSYIWVYILYYWDRKSLYCILVHMYVCLCYSMNFIKRTQAHVKYRAGPCLPGEQKENSRAREIQSGIDPLLWTDSRTTRTRHLATSHITPSTLLSSVFRLRHYLLPPRRSSENTHERTGSFPRRGGRTEEKNKKTTTIVRIIMRYVYVCLCYIYILIRTYMFRIWSIINLYANYSKNHK